MKSITFDGRKYALEKEQQLFKKVTRLKNRGLTPKLVTIIIGDDPASVLYVNLKKKAAERIGAELEIEHFDENSDVSKILELIKKLNKDNAVHGIMVQLPLPENIKSETPKVLHSIMPEKDVDGLRRDSKFTHPTAMAVMEIIEEAMAKTSKVPKTASVIGANGMVGRSVVPLIQKAGFTMTDPSHADVVVSATGEPGIVKGDMVKEGAIVIDVGSPKGDVDYESVLPKASFITPVPGGVGPVTITCLLWNLVNAASASQEV